MNLECNLALGVGKTSGSQIARVRTESWFGKFGYCLRCTSDRLEATKPNTPACDFVCPVCEAPYELKSGAGRLGVKVVDGAFDAMMRRIREGRAPNLLLLRYTPEWNVHAITALHSVFLTPTVLEKRPPLSLTARRAGWVGCNLLLSRVPRDGRIALVQDGVAMAKAEARRIYAQSERFEDLKPKQRGWTALVLAFVRKIGKEEFTLADIYAFETAMHAAYPENSHVREKIRQQMQVLRDLGYVEFLSKRGEYRMLL
jgi:type II restriction enzyme